jgi:hypothetical protein
VGQATPRLVTTRKESPSTYIGTTSTTPMENLETRNTLTRTLIVQPNGDQHPIYAYRLRPHLLHSDGIDMARPSNQPKLAICISCNNQARLVKGARANFGVKGMGESSESDHDWAELGEFEI